MTTNPLGLTKTLTAAGPVDRRRIAAFTVNEGEVTQASAATDKICGVTGMHPAMAAGDRLDVIQGGHADVEFGGTVEQGDQLTADANGKAIKATPAAGVTVRIAGYANQDATDGEYGQMLVAPGSYTGSV